MRTDRAAADRLLIALLIAGLVHAVVILGIGFEPPKPEKIRKSLAITLIHTPSREAPEQADFLAPENQFGSGTGEKKAIPKALPVPREGMGKHAEPAPEPHPVREAKRRAVLVQEKSAKQIATEDGEDEKTKPEPQKFSADLLSQQIAEVSVELSHTQETEARNPRIVYINSVNAHKYKAAAYEHSWQQKIERIGNLNYPEEARRQKLSGSLLMTVGIRADGSVDKIKINHSSGYPALDAAAERIVRLASPFSAFPEDLKQEADILMITRTWRFYNDHRLETSR